MITGERLTAYIHSLDCGNGQLLDQIEGEAKADHVPVIRKEMQSLLRFFMKSYRPGKILEVGTATGFPRFL